jgi:dTDP-4-amino-4,6-dideoxy-D-galactose acyltransferase
MMIEPLEWDTNFFSKKIGQIQFDTFNNENLEDECYDLLYVKSNVNQIFQIKNYEESFSETKVIYSKGIIGQKSIDDRNIFSGFEIAIDKSKIYDLAYESGKFSRFNLDKKFTKSEFTKLYRKWVNNSFERLNADNILVYIKDEHISGFVTYKITGNTAVIGLIGVNQLCQGKGIGSKLIKSVENILNKEKVIELIIPTQLKNTQACNFYNKMGYKIIDKLIVKHFWRI